MRSGSVRPVPNVGPVEIIIVLAVVVLLFGAKRLPEFGGSLGKGLRDFGRGIRGDDDDEKPAVEPAKAKADSAP
jgi:sec-independent protein translocase protein TatA